MRPFYRFLWSILFLSAASCALPTKPPEVYPTPYASLLSTKIFVQNVEADKTHFSKVEYVKFTVPKSGKAILIIVNGARAGAKPENRLEGKISLNGSSVVTPRQLNKSINLLEVPVKLKQGENKLGVRLKGKLNKRIALRIEAPADEIVLKSIANPVVLNKTPLQVQAKVTGLGVPVAGANVKFKTYDLGAKIKRHAVTSSSGVATTSMSGFGEAGEGKLRAKVIMSDLSAKTRFTVVETPNLGVFSKRSSLLIRVGKQSSFDFTVRIQNKNRQTRLINLAADIQPNPEGLKFDSSFPLNGILNEKTQEIAFNAGVEGLIPGRYQLKLSVTQSGTDESASLEIPITVRKQHILSAPTIIPSGIPQSDEASKLIFRTLISGYSEPPKAVHLDEVDQAGKLINKAIAQLRDDGQDGDSVKRDGFYSATLNLEAATEGARYYRLRAELSTEIVISKTAKLTITSLPLKARPYDPDKIISIPKNNIKLIANELIITAQSGTSTERVQEMVEEVANDLNNDAKIVGYQPLHEQYLIEFKTDNTPETLQQTIKVFDSYDEVVFASENAFATLAAVPNDARIPSNCAGTISGCQHYLDTIRAEEGWKLMDDRGQPLSSSQVKVAVIDTGVDFNHPELSGLSINGNNPNCNASPSTCQHGTRVAGLISAKHHLGVGADPDNGIAGITNGTEIASFGASSISSWENIDWLTNASYVEAKIINISYGWNNSTVTKAAICNAIKKQRLIVAAAGNIDKQSGACVSNESIINLFNYYPAKYLDGYTEGAAEITCPGDVMPTMIGDSLLAVGATDIDKNDDGAVDIFQDVIAANLVGGTACSYVRPWVKLYAPGEDILSTKKGGGYELDSGTSFATPMVSGGAALLWSTDPGGLTNLDIGERLKQRGREIDLAHPDQIHEFLTTAGGSSTVLETRAGQPVVFDLLATLAEPPVITSVPIVEATVDVPYSYTIVAMDPDPGDTLSYSLDVNPGAMTLSGNTITWTPASGDVGTNNVTVRVIDDFAGLSVTQSFTITVSDALNVVQVLDRSGSMAGPAVETSPQSKLELMQSEAKFFIDNMPIGINQKIGLVQYNHTIPDFIHQTGTTPVYADNDTNLATLSLPRVDKLKAAIDDMEASGATSIGNGIRDALTQLSPETGNRMILLMTDGRENTSEFVVGGSLRADLDAADIRVFSLGLGYGAGGINDTVLSELANTNPAGDFRIANDPAQYRKSYLQMLASATGLDLASDPIYELNAGQSASLSVTVSPDESSVMFVSSWDDIDDAVDLVLIPPNKKLSPITPENLAGSVTYGQDKRHAYYKIQLPWRHHSKQDWVGTWQMKLTARQNIGSNKITATASAVVASQTRMRVKYDKPLYQTGDQVIATATLTRSRLPVTDAKVSLICDVPTASAGNILHRGMVDPASLDPDANIQQDTISLLQQKLTLLQKQTGKDLLTRGESDLELYDDGEHHDGAAGDGVYANSFINTQMPGSYSCLFRARDIPTAYGVKLQREWSIAFHTEAGIEPDESDIDVQLARQTADGYQYKISVTPRDRFGNYLGPGYPIKMYTSKAPDQAVKLVDPQVSGSYTGSIFIPAASANKDTRLVLEVAGKTFSQFRPPGLSPWRSSFHAGIATAAGNFKHTHDDGLSLTLDLSYQFNEQQALVGLLGFHEFEAKTPGSDRDWLHLSANYKYRLATSVVESYVMGGVGYYDPDNDSGDWGVNAEVGIEYKLTPTLLLQAGVGWHRVFDSPDTEFMTSQVGMLLEF